jgi:hypothetical protein
MNDAVNINGYSIRFMIDLICFQVNMTKTRYLMINIDIFNEIYIKQNYNSTL